jgi:hypothetical protein
VTGAHGSRLDERSGTVALHAQTGASVADSVTFEQRFTPGEGLAGWVVSTRLTSAVDQALRDRARTAAT